MSSRAAVSGSDPGGVTVEFRVTAIGAHGDGVADWQGRRLHVPFTAPGDVVRARLGPRRGGGLAAEAIEVTVASPERAAPPCRYFGRCGGCALQHLSAASYAGWKRTRVAEALSRRGLAGVDVAPVVAVPPASRRRAAFTVERATGGVALGFNARFSHRTIDIADCPLLTPGLDRLLAPLRAALPSLLGDSARGRVTATETATGVDLMIGAARPLDLAGRDRLAALAEAADAARVSWQADAGGPPEPVAERRRPRMVFSGVAVDYPPAAFVQPTAAGEAAIAALVRDGLVGSTRVADLFAGLGAFGFALAGSAAVHAVEVERALVTALSAAAGQAGLDGRVTAEARDLERRPLSPAELERFDGCVFDPPRAGAAAQAKALAEAPGLARVVAVSCNPATFARDARILVDGGFRLARVVPVDQFTWSAHVEVVGLFAR